MTEEGFQLYASPSFLEGMARLWDPAGFLNQYNRSATPRQADQKAIMQDWFMVGSDIRAAIKDVEKKQTKSK